VAAAGGGGGTAAGTGAGGEACHAKEKPGSGAQTFACNPLDIAGTVGIQTQDTACTGMAACRDDHSLDLGNKKMHLSAILTTDGSGEENIKHGVDSSHTFDDFRVN